MLGPCAGDATNDVSTSIGLAEFDGGPGRTRTANQRFGSRYARPVRLPDKGSETRWTRCGLKARLFVDLKPFPEGPTLHHLNLRPRRRASSFSQEVAMPNGFHGHGIRDGQRARSWPEQQRILDSAEASERAATAACERAAERDNLDAEACEFLRPYHDGTWEISQRAFSFGELSGRPAPSAGV